MDLHVRRALISVSDKQGLTDFARRLHARGVEILSTGGTCRALRAAGVAAIEISDYTGFPEIMDGRVKTLHPKVHGGILGRRGADDAVMAELGIAPIDLVVVNLYPFEQTVAQPGCTDDEAIENIDIGGPALLRAAAKNHAHVAVVVEPSDYAAVLAGIEAGGIAPATRRQLAAKAFAHAARYDGAIAAYLTGPGSADNISPFPGVLTLQFDKRQDLRYGENPHQSAAFYAERSVTPGTLAAARQLQGKELSFNNLADADAALACVRAFDEQPACVIVKHANPCGVALGKDLKQAYLRAYATDPVSAFGGIIAFNRALDRAAAQAVIAKQFVEVIVAPEIVPEALDTLKSKPNLRVLAVGSGTAPAGWDFKRIAGGLLVQTADRAAISLQQLKTVTPKKPTAAQLKDLLFAWRVAQFVKSNAIVYAKGGRTLGIGAGQMSRVDSARIAALKAKDAKLSLAGAVMASDAFFPFRDSVETAARHGIRAIIQPGGSLRDAEVIAAADRRGLAMVFTGVRHFKH